MVVIDCERMRYPNTGLYTFCKELSMAMVRLYGMDNNKIGFYVPAGMEGMYGRDLYYRRRYPLDKLWLPHSKHYDLWHCTFQLSRYFPSRTKKIITVHDLNFLYEKTGDKQLKYIKRLQRIIDKFDRIVAISEFTRRDLLANIDVRGKDVDVVYNGCNIYEGKLVEPAVTPRAPFIFTVGTVVKKKNFHVLPCLLAGNDFELLIAGICSGYEQQIMDEARRWGVVDRVKVLGPVDEAVKHWYLANCLAFAFPSVAEGFGLPVIEAMAYGKPVFLSDHTCLPEIGGDMAYYFNHDFDPEAMQREFASGLDDYAGGGKRPEDIKAYARGFTWDKAAKEYSAIYAEMLRR